MRNAWYAASLAIPAMPAISAIPTADTITGRCRRTGRDAVRSLYAELVLYPKPGLVSLVDSGSHTDMDAATFVRSLFSLRRYFVAIAAAGAANAPFAVLKRLGIDAEQRMLAATGGINTHRGAIFSLGLLCAAAACCDAHPSSAAIRQALSRWRGALLQHQGGEASHGRLAGTRYSISGAREEAVQGFPSVFDIALPRLRQTLAEGRGWHCAQVDALFALMAHLSDTNVYHRGGAAGAALVRSTAQAFLAMGGTAAPGWREHATGLHHRFVRHGLSPGGAADLLAATVFVHRASSQATAIDPVTIY